MSEWYRNASGSVVVQLLNSTDDPLVARLSGAPEGAVTAFRTDDTHSLAPSGTARRAGAALLVEVGARSLSTVRIG